MEIEHFKKQHQLFGMTYLPISIILIHWHLLKPNLKLIYSLNTIKRNYTNISVPVSILWNGTGAIQIHYYYYYYYIYNPDSQTITYMIWEWASLFHGNLNLVKTFNSCDHYILKYVSPSLHLLLKVAQILTDSSYM